VPDQPEPQPLDAEHLAFRDDVAAFSLGGNLDPAAQAHLAGCVRCSADLVGYREVTGRARAAVAAGGVDDMPPQSVWHRIAAAVGFEADPTAFSAVLEPSPAVPDARAVARIRDHEAGRLLTVDASGLPNPAGYYAVWLSDPRERDIVAMGALGPELQGLWTIPPGLEFSSYPVIMVSEQRYGGVPTPGPVVLRGAFAR
jgi:Anti-sigma-K factor rskA